jgi:pre-mRNA-splicing factor ATP-dependent RNA helicase DHX38/PRP16
LVVLLDYRAPSKASSKGIGAERYSAPETREDEIEKSNKNEEYIFENDSVKLDRDWYDVEENAAVDMDHNPFSGYEAMELAVNVDSANISGKRNTKAAARQKLRSQDNDRWESNRLLTSGVVQKADESIELDEHEERVHVMVHDIRPPFLDGRQVFTKQLETVSVIRDPTSDMAQVARQGSELVRFKKREQERRKGVKETLEVSGTALGNLTGMQTNEEVSDDKTSLVTVAGDEKISNTNEDSSSRTQFSKSKTIKEQREYLPVFSVREDMMNVIRENQVVIVVGQTGSGKTTQLAQYLWEDGYGSMGMIACTQPRRVAAMSVAKRVSEEMSVELGGLVGYTIRFEDCTSPSTEIRCM